MKIASNSFKKAWKRTRKMFGYATKGAIALFLASASHAQTVDPQALDGSIYVKFADSYDFYDHKGDYPSIDRYPMFKALEGRYGKVKVERHFWQSNDPILKRTFRIEFSDIVKVEQLLEELNRQKGVIAYAEKVPLMQITLVPNDPFYTTTYNHWLTQIKAPQAWDIATGDKDLARVAIVDNAVWTAHPDLVNQIVYTWDAANGGDNCNPPSSISPTSSAGGDWSHGTHCAGISGAETNNNLGMASTSYGVGIVAIKATSSASSTGRVITHGYEGIQRAWIHGDAKIINCSWGGTGSSSTSMAVVNEAWANGRIVVAAAGNDNNAESHYPSDYATAVCVASVNSVDGKASYSNYQPAVDIGAPGGDWAEGKPMLSTTYSDGTLGRYDRYHGTSMAAPVIAGALGLMTSHNPDLSAAELLDCLYSTADPISSGFSSINRRVNLRAAIECVDATTSGVPLALFEATPLTLFMDQVVTFTDKSKRGPTAWTWTITPNTAGAFDYIEGTTNESQHPIVRFNQPGYYTVKLLVSNEFGEAEATKANYILVKDPAAVPCVNNGNFVVGSHTSYLRHSFDGQGYVSGHNEFGDKAKADRFTLSNYSEIPDPRLNGFRLYFGKASGTGMVRAVVWDNTGTSSVPGLELASALIPVEEIPVDGTPIQIDFDDAPVLLTTDFFIGIELDYTKGDTVALYTNVPDQMLPRPGTAWEQLSTNEWVRYNSSFSRWGIQVAHAIIPDICPNAAAWAPSPNADQKIAPSNAVLSIGTSELLEKVNLFPNPTSQTLKVDLQLSASSDVQLTAYDMLGKVVLSDGLKNIHAATHTLDVSGLEQGTYLLSIKSGNQTTIKKFTVVR